MDVHDCGSYTGPAERGQISERQDALSGETIKDRPARVLRSGMVLTLEPGIYVRAAEGVPCLLYTSDADDERSCVELGGRRII